MRSLKITITPLLWRVIVILCIFVGISGFVGPKIISSNIMFRDGFAVYGGIGKAIIFGFIAFALLVRRNAVNVVLKPWGWMLLGWMAAACIALATASICINHLLAGSHTALYIVGAHLSLLLSLCFAAIGCFGLRNIQLIWQVYRRNIIHSLIIAACFYAFLTIVYMLWSPLADTVLFCVRGLLSMSGLHATFMPPNMLLFDKFGITVAQYCSGIESIALFTGLYVIVGILDWQRLNKRRYFGVFPIALLVLSVLNIFRVYGLIMAGYYINPQIAFSLFHTYAGTVFFMLYSIAFWSVAYTHLLAKSDEAPVIPRRT